ncbi:MAG TPA: polymorphic toxin type 5 domain-containing protein, partial [Puia sp.]|nr:polymorphic toxin type 5 domain-containing protein [Puia sp.]
KYQLTGITPAAAYYSISDFTNSAATPTLVKLKHHRSLFLQDDLVTPLPLYQMDTLGLVSQQYHLAFNAAVTALAGKTTTTQLQSAGYAESDMLVAAKLFPSGDAKGEWWVPSGTIVYLNGGVAQPFLLPYQYLDAFGDATTVGFDAHWLLQITVTDAVDNKTTAAPMDYRVLAPTTVTDPNDNATDYKYDGLGLLVATAQRGKGEGDVFDASFTSDLSAAQVVGFFNDPFTNGPSLLQGATTRYIYDFTPGGPFSAGVIGRTVHVNQVTEPWVAASVVPYQFSFEYTDGLGRTAMKKIQADVTTGTPQPGSCDGNSTPQHQWIGNGKTVYNNKGKAVMQYEPYFSANPNFEKAPANGVTAILHYDPVGRLIRTDFPDGSFSQTVFDGWLQIISDQNDTVLGSTWFQNNFNSSDPLDVDAATKTKAHNDTPAAAHLDPLGRNFFTVGFNKDSLGNPLLYATQTVLDLESNPLSVIDAMGNTVMQWDYDLLNRPIHQVSMDSGERWIFHDVMDKPFALWEVDGANSIEFIYSYDALRRPLRSRVTINGVSYLAAYNIYGENVVIHGVADINNNLRGKVYRQFDESGLVTNYLFDFKGNLIQTSRVFANAFQAANSLLPVVPWTGASGDLSLLTTTEEYVSLVSYDALNRPMVYTRPFIPVTSGVILSIPYSKAAINNADVYVQGYGESGALNAVSLFYGAGSAATPYVTRICHNEKGQRLCIQYGNNTVTRYTYDPDTFRLTRLLTTVNFGTTILQDLNFYYDPVGNITYQLDNAQPPIFYNNQKVLSDGNYTYDAIYRLIIATGREQVAQNTVDESAANTDYRNYPFDVAPMPAPTDPLAMRNYTQNYSYDPVGNMLKLQHVAGAGSYTRSFVYNNDPGHSGANNQLVSTTVGAGPTVNYNYDGHGNMLNLPELVGMGWDYKDQFVAATQQAVISGTGQTTYYNYDAGGMRARKATMSSTSGTAAAKRVSERLYIGNFEIYRTYDSMGNVTLQRETLHVMDDLHRIALVDNKTIDTLGADPTNLNAYYPRYQYSNHLETAYYELDGSGNIISYEEYHPYGTSSYQAADGALDVPQKRYRYTGKERDEESGLYYYGARYYAAWLARWTASDPAGLVDGPNAYVYVRNNPLQYTDSTGTQCDPTNQSCPDTQPENNEDLVCRADDSSNSSALAGGTMSSSASLVGDTTSVGQVLVGTSRSQMRSAAQAIIRSDPDHPLQFLLNESGKFKPTRGLTHAELADAPDLVQMGHISSDKLGGNERLMLQDAWENQFSNITIEHPRVGGAVVNQEAVDIGGIAVSRQTAEGWEVAWEYSGGQLGLPPGTTASAPIVPEMPMMTPGASLLSGGMGALNAAGGVFMLASIDAEHDPGVVTVGKATSGTASVAGGGMMIGGALAGDAGVVALGGTVAGVGGVIAAPIMIYEMRPRGWIAVDPALEERNMQRYRNGENVNPFCASCHGPGGALDPNNDWNAGGARREAFVNRLQWRYLGD